MLDWPYFYIIGGTTGFVYNLDVHRLNLETREWKLLYNTFSEENIKHAANLPLGRYEILDLFNLLLWGLFGSVGRASDF